MATWPGPWCRLRVMPIVIREIHASSSPSLLNEEWFVVENTGDKPFSTAGCTIAVARGQTARPRPVGTMDPGFTLLPGQKKQVVSGNPGKKAHGKVTATDDLEVYHLFLGTSLISGPGAVLILSLKQHEFARTTYAAPI